MRARSWIDRNVAVPSISISDTAYWMLMSGGSLLSTTDPGADRNRIWRTSVGFTRRFFSNVFHRVERRLNRRSNRPAFQVRSRNFVTLAQLLDEHFRIGLRRVRQQEIVAARKHIVDAGPSALARGEPT